ncbi:hypothetical protein Hypma_004466 [Hypsizygus marmoreus]|uniref:Uncharacterized protein n=1 Tax=Hypsizygus marmoreus TaxID=39966 RepID=A0A369JYE0_HYPMA|nr:hypothetical protein Hypma_004466 [Hypsizygus marmoreus]
MVLPCQAEIAYVPSIDGLGLPLSASRSSYDASHFEGLVMNSFFLVSEEKLICALARPLVPIACSFVYKYIFSKLLATSSTSILLALDISPRYRSSGS